MTSHSQQLPVIGKALDPDDDRLQSNWVSSRLILIVIGSPVPPCSWIEVSFQRARVLFEREVTAERIRDKFAASRAARTRADTPALLKGLIFTATAAATTSSSTKKGARRYRSTSRWTPPRIANPAMRVSRAFDHGAGHRPSGARGPRLWRGRRDLRAAEVRRCMGPTIPCGADPDRPVAGAPVDRDVRGAGDRCPDRRRLGRHAGHDGATKKGAAE